MCSPAAEKEAAAVGLVDEGHGHSEVIAVCD